jgi:hypothetical protein
VKSIITQPVQNERLPGGFIIILGATYAGKADVERVEVSMDNGKTWNLATFIVPHEPFAWRQWQYVWEVTATGEHTILSRATDSEGRQQPMNARWNVLGYGNNVVLDHAVTIVVT